MGISCIVRVELIALREILIKPLKVRGIFARIHKLVQWKRMDIIKFYHTEVLKDGVCMSIET